MLCVILFACDIHQQAVDLRKVARSELGMKGNALCRQLVNAASQGSSMLMLMLKLFVQSSAGKESPFHLGSCEAL